MRASALVSGLLLLLLPAAGVVFASGQPQGSEESSGGTQRQSFLGLTLTEALLELQSQGLSIVFTSELVRPDMTVEVEPTAIEARLVLDQLLAPHGLRAEEGAGGTLVVVWAPKDNRWGRCTGAVRSRETQEPLASAVIRVVESGIEVWTGADGRFDLPNLEPGVYTLEARVAGFADEHVDGVVVTAGRPTEVDLALEPLPFVRDEIVVRPSQLSLLQEEPAAPLSLSRSQIEALPHLGGDIFRALSLLPGTAANDVTAQFSVHGGRRDEVQILLDGQELFDAHHLKDYDNALSVVASETLSGVSLSTGAYPARHGDRMSGVLDMTTASPSGGRRTRLSLSVLNALAASAGTFHDGRGGWLASARRGSIDLASRIFGDEDPLFWDVFGKVEHQLSTRHHLRANFLRSGDALDFTEAVDGEEKLFDTDYDTSYLWLTHQAVLGERLLVETAVSRSGFERDRRGAEDEEEQSFVVLDQRDVDVVGLAQSWSFQAATRHAVSWGYELRRTDAEYDYFNRTELNLILGTPLSEPRSGVPRFEDDFRGEHVAAWASDRFSPLEPLTVELGLRYDRLTLTDDTVVSPRVNVAWRLGEASVVRGAWGHFFQSQRPYELQVEDGETSFFSAERSEHWVVGYERLFGGHERAALRALRVEAYRREITDPRPRYENLFEPINTFPEIEPDRVRIAPGRGTAEGIEILLRGSAGPRIDWWMNYAYALAEDRIDGEDVYRQNDQTHTVNVDVNYRLGRSWNVNVAWRFHTGWPTTAVFLQETEGPDGEPVLTPVPGPLYSERLPSYHRMDVRASRRWQLGMGQLIFFVDIQNVYDQNNVAGFDLAFDGEEGALIVAEENWVGFFPSVGIAWEF